MKVKYLKKMPSRVGQKVLLKDIEEGDILQIPYPGYKRTYIYYKVEGGYLYRTNRKKNPYWSLDYYSIERVRNCAHWLSKHEGTVIGHIPV